MGSRQFLETPGRGPAGKSAGWVLSGSVSYWLLGWTRVVLENRGKSLNPAGLDFFSRQGSGWGGGSPEGWVGPPVQENPQEVLEKTWLEKQRKYICAHCFLEKLGKLTENFSSAIGRTKINEKKIISLV